MPDLNLKYINVKEFRENGYLQELNRRFLHPIGLAMAVNIDENGNETLGDIWDYRDDPEGILYDNNLANSDKFRENINNINIELDAKSEVRQDKYGFVIQHPEF